MVYKTLMLPVNVLVLSFLMVVVVSTMLALYRSAVAGLIAPLLQIITDSSRYGASTEVLSESMGVGPVTTVESVAVRPVEVV